MTITTTQREAALRLIDELSRPHCDLGQQEAAALLRELLAEPQGEPVAWWCKHPPEKGGGGFMTCDETAAQHYMYKFRTVDNGPVLVPLYIHPPQQRKPLSDEQIYAAISDQVFWATSKNFIVRVVRDVEAAHGITGGKE